MDFLHREKEPKDLYPDVPMEQVKNAGLYLALVKDGTLKTVGIDREEAVEAIKSLRGGAMPTYAIEGHARDYIDYINGNREER